MEAEGSWSGSTGTRLVDGRFLGVLGYAPRHFDSRAALLAEYGVRLRALRGRRLRRSFAVWERERWSAWRARLSRHRLDAWFCDGPVILDFGVTRLELAGFKFHLCVSRDLIDVAEPIEWDGRLEWREDPLRELAQLRNRTIDTIRVVEYQGLLNGLQFCSGSDCIELFNALDARDHGCARAGSRHSAGRALVHAPSDWAARGRRPCGSRRRRFSATRRGAAAPTTRAPNATLLLAA